MRNEDSNFLQNFGIHLPDITVSKPKDSAATQQSSYGIVTILNVYCKAHYKHRLNSNGTYSVSKLQTQLPSNEYKLALLG